MEPSEVAELKARLPEYLEAVGATPHMATSHSFYAKCPLHHDQKPSLSGSREESGRWVWNCHACNVGGTIIDLHARRRQLDPRKDFQQICAELKEMLANGIPGADSAVAVANNQHASGKATTEPFSAEYIEETTTPWRKQMYCDDSLRTQIGNDLGIDPEWLKYFAQWSLDSVGIAPAGWHLPNGNGSQLREPRLAYIGDGYIKIRAPFGDGRKPRFLTVGTARRPWLSGPLVHNPMAVLEVHLHESESSALALVQAGYLRNDFSSVVMATSGAGGFKEHWAEMFAGREVHFWPDDDDAGRDFVDKTCRLLSGKASRLLVHDWRIEK